jgi:hypothetical protein
MLLAQSTDPVNYHAQQLHNSMEGMGTDDSMLIKTIISRSEVWQRY